MSRSRDDILDLLRGKRLRRLPAFSGLPSLTRPGLDAKGLRFGELHDDPAKMAAAAASTYETFGFESAVVPFDLCVEAEALGCAVDLNADEPSVLHPVITARLGASPEVVDVRPPIDLAAAGRLPVVAEAIRRLKDSVGREIIIGAWIPGPFTLAWQIVEVEPLILAVRQPDRLAPLLATLASFLARVANHYRDAGADFITIHEMGGSPQIVGPTAFRSVVLPALKGLVAHIRAPRVVSVCGYVQPVLADLAACGAEAVSVDHRCDLAQARQIIDRASLLFGNFDSMGVLAEGTPESITECVRAIASAGADAIWPGCDLWPEVPEENMRALMDTARELPGHASTTGSRQ